MINNLIRTRTDNIFVQMLRYSLSGGVAFIVDATILVLLTEFAGFNYLVSAIFGFIAGLTTVYFLSSYWVFSSRAFESRKKEFLVFALIGIVGLGFNELFIWIFTEYAHFFYMISKIFATILVYLWNFLARKYIVFS